MVDDLLFFVIFTCLLSKLGLHIILSFWFLELELKPPDPTTVTTTAVVDAELSEDVLEQPGGGYAGLDPYKAILL